MAALTAPSTSGPWTGDVQQPLHQQQRWRARGYITADARNQTEYGTVRSYIAVGISTNDVGVDTRRTSSARTAPSSSGRASRSVLRSRSLTSTACRRRRTGASTRLRHRRRRLGRGWLYCAVRQRLLGHASPPKSAARRRSSAKAQHSGRTVASVAGVRPLRSVGSRRRHRSAGAASQAPGYGGFQVPDIVANLRVDQAWGSAQIMGAAHQVNASYYGPSPQLAAYPGRTPVTRATKWGWAVGAGLKLNTPWLLNWLAPAQATTSRPRSTTPKVRCSYIFQNPEQQLVHTVMATVRGYGVLADGVYGGTALVAGDRHQLELTTAWGVNAAYEHFWNPRWRTSLYGGYAAVSYNNQANAILCYAARRWQRRRWHWQLAVADAGLRQQLDDLVDRLAHPVERHQGLLHGS